MSGDIAEILKQEADSAGLDASLALFTSGNSLRERLAHNPVLMAPMAGVSDGAYRLLARAGGAALAYTEMVSVSRTLRFSCLAQNPNSFVRQPLR